jgi:hypothetical protein
MSKRSAAVEPNSAAVESPLERTLPVWAKGLFSALVALHVVAVASAPLAFICSSGGATSPAAGALAGFFRPYTGAMYLNHGYAFFAPDPGPNHLVDYKLEFSDGRPSAVHRFPDLKTERPRLLYHRYFMLAETLNNRYAPPEYQPEPSPPPLTASADDRARYQIDKQNYERGRNEWQHAREQYEAMRKSIGEHLQHEYSASEITVTRIEHRLASPAEVQQQQRRLNAPDTYRELSESSGRGNRT